MENTSKFTIGLNAGVVGRTSRLILGGLIPLITIIRELVLARPSIDFLGMTALYFVVVFGIYMAAHYFLGERLLARVSPWVGTAILVVPPSLALLLLHFHLADLQLHHELRGLRGDGHPKLDFPPEVRCLLPLERRGYCREGCHRKQGQGQGQASRMS